MGRHAWSNTPPATPTQAVHKAPEGRFRPETAGLGPALHQFVCQNLHGLSLCHRMYCFCFSLIHAPVFHFCTMLILNVVSIPLFLGIYCLYYYFLMHHKKRENSSTIICKGYT